MLLIIDYLIFPFQLSEILNFILIFKHTFILLPLMINSKILKNSFQGLKIEKLDSSRVGKQVNPNTS